MDKSYYYNICPAIDLYNTETGEYISSTNSSNSCAEAKEMAEYDYKVNVTACYSED